MRSVSTDVLVVGAGPAGLAVGACLRKRGIDFLVLEQDCRIASRWHHHYTRLHLHTDKHRSELPHRGYPTDYPRYPSRLQVIDYFEDYADHFRIQPQFNQRVTHAEHRGDCWEVMTDDAVYRSQFLVVATGYNAEPNIPEWPGKERFGGPIIHSSEYRDGHPFRGETALVVGLGNSGGEIAIDLWEYGVRAAIAVRGPVNLIPREVVGIPVLALAIPLNKLPARLADAFSSPMIRFTLGDIRQYGLQALPVGPNAQIRHYGRVPLIDVGTVELIRRRHVALRPGIMGFNEESVEFADGRLEHYDSVILATGYRPRVDRFLTGAESVLGEGGRPFISGRETGVPGLYFCGFYVSPTGMLREISIEAKRIARHIRRRLHRRNSIPGESITARS